MSRLISNTTLRDLRNQIPIQLVITKLLKLQTVNDDGLLRFQCPKCRHFNTATNSNTNLARCFRCQLNFNPIDLVIAAHGCSFKDAISSLSPYLNNTPSPTAQASPHPNSNICSSNNTISTNSQLDLLIKALADKTKF